MIDSERIATLTKAVADAIDLADEGWSYADNYYREKWEYDKHRAGILATVAKVI